LQLNKKILQNIFLKNKSENFFSVLEPAGANSNTNAYVSAAAG
jgi:hypothetical protein